MILRYRNSFSFHCFVLKNCFSLTSSIWFCSLNVCCLNASNSKFKSFSLLSVSEGSSDGIFKDSQPAIILDSITSHSSSLSKEIKAIFPFWESVLLNFAVCVLVLLVLPKNCELHKINLAYLMDSLLMVNQSKSNSLMLLYIASLADLHLCSYLLLQSEYYYQK